MIVPYVGELFISPVPLELSLNYCSHKCLVCFANLNKPDRAADVPRIMRMFQEYTKRNTLEARLMQEGYPICFSNHVDPFANSNYKQSVPMIQVMTELGLPIQIQTRGGRQEAIDEALEVMPKSVWYISISQTDDTLRKQVEPGAPTIESRFLLMSRLRDLGHKVVLGLNPLVPEWLPRGPRDLMHRAHDCGAESVWIEKLHLNYSQEKNMTEKEKLAVGQTLINRSKKRVTDTLDWSMANEARAVAKELGMPSYSMGQPYYSNFMDTYTDVYKKTFLTMQHFINYCYDNKLENKLISFDQYVDFFIDSFPKGVMPIDSYLGATAHNLWWTSKIPPQMSFRQLLAIFWREPITRQCPVKWNCFSYAAQKTDKGWVVYADGSNMPYIIFSPEGFDDSYVDVDLDFQALSEDEVDLLLDEVLNNS